MLESSQILTENVGGGGDEVVDGGAAAISTLACGQRPLRRRGDLAAGPAQRFALARLEPYAKRRKSTVRARTLVGLGRRYLRATSVVSAPATPLRRTERVPSLSHLLPSNGPFPDGTLCAQRSPPDLAKPPLSCYDVSVRHQMEPFKTPAFGLS